MTNAQLNRNYDYTSTVSASVAEALISKAGIENRPVIDRKGRSSSKWFVPEEAQLLIGGHGWTWDTEEALTWALVIIAAVDDPDLLNWS